MAGAVDDVATPMATPSLSRSRAAPGSSGDSASHAIMEAGSGGGQGAAAAGAAGATSATADEASTPGVGEGERVGGTSAQAALMAASDGGLGSAPKGSGDDNGGSGGAEAGDRSAAAAGAACAVSAATGEASTPSIGEGERVGGMRAQAALTLACGGGPGSALDGGGDADVLPEAIAAPTGLGGGGGGSAPATGAPANEPSTEKASTCSTSCCMGVWRAGCGGGEVESGWRSPAGRGEAEAPAELTTPSPNGVPRCASLAARKVARRAACARRVDGERWRCGECCPGELEADGGRWRGGEKDGSDGDGEGLRRCASRCRLAGWCWWGQWWCGGRWEG